ncbi:hypothetical protein GA0115239_117610 [Streptomyces sp. BpilaLS-43]|nr:hypothetical protein GA0115239_117610 [Streptomyces sp. BpilaLS-43]
MSAARSNETGGTSPGAVYMPLNELSGHCPKLTDDRPLITFRTDGIRSAGVANLLVENGLHAIHVSWGLVDRRAAGKPLIPRGVVAADPGPRTS